MPFGKFGVDMFEVMLKQEGDMFNPIIARRAHASDHLS